MKIYQKHYSASKHVQKLRLAADNPQSLEITELSRAHHLRSSVLFLFFLFYDGNISESDALLSIKNIQKLRLAADTPQSLEITELSRAHHLRNSVLFFILFVLG
jgi:hypothetical protein